MGQHFTRLIAATVAAVATPAVAQAPEPVTIAASLLVERPVKKADGSVTRQLVARRTATPGDTVVYAYSYRNNTRQPIGGFAVTAPLKALRFVEAMDPGATVSVDGGKTFGALGALRLTGADGKPRLAQADDVTTVRWAFARPLAPGASGTLRVKAVVR